MPGEGSSNPYQRARRPIKTNIGFSDRTTINMYGKDVPSELIGTVQLGDMAMLSVTGEQI